MKTRLTLLTFVVLALPLPLVLMAQSGAPAQARNEANLPPATSSGRQAVSNKLDRIRFDTVVYDGLPLSEVVLNLRDEARKRDPEKKGVNLIVNPNSTAATTEAGPGAPPQEAIDVGSLIIRIKPPLNDVRLVDVLDAMVKVAERPVKYSIEDYGVVFSLKASEPARQEDAGFIFPGGNPRQFLDAVEQQYKVDWLSVADIPKELADVRIPRLRIPQGSLGSMSRRTDAESEPLAALVSLYNQLGEQKTELGHLLVKGDLHKPSVVMFVPDKSVAEAQPKMKVKAFSIYGISEAERAKLQVDIERARREAMDYAEHLRGSSGAQNLEGMVAVHDDTSLLVATGPESFVEMVESIVTACQTKERTRNPGSPMSAPAAK